MLSDLDQAVKNINLIGDEPAAAVHELIEALVSREKNIVPLKVQGATIVHFLCRVVVALGQHRAREMSFLPPGDGQSGKHSINRYVFCWIRVVSVLGQICWLIFPLLAVQSPDAVS